MSFFSKVFGSRSDSREVKRIFEKARKLLTDDATQNASLSDSVRALIEGGNSVDEVPGGVGEFGRSSGNPIPVNGPLGELSYLSRLSTVSGVGMLGHRFGTADKVDIYEVVSMDGKVWDVLFLDMYHPRKSRKCPSGYRLPKPGGFGSMGPFITCVNFHVEDFPLSMADQVGKYTQETIGFPLKPPDFERRIRSQEFVRPRKQNLAFAALARLSGDEALCAKFVNAALEAPE